MNIYDIKRSINYKSIDELSKFLINKNGIYFQSFINTEENSELIIELLKNKPTKNLDSEMADVIITLQHIINSFQIKYPAARRFVTNKNKRIDSTKLCIYLAQLTKETAKGLNRSQDNLDQITEYISLVSIGILKYIQKNNNLESVNKFIQQKIKRTKKRNNFAQHSIDQDKNKNWDQIFLLMAFAMASGSHCVSRQVGALLVKNKRIISTGINGTPEGSPNCDDLFPAKTEPGFNRADHHKFSTKNEIHAEMNAIIFNAKKGGYSIDGSTLYCTTQPCDDCLKNILQTGIGRIVYAESYDFSNYSDFILESINRKGIKLEHRPIQNTSKSFVFIQNQMVKTSR